MMHPISPMQTGFAALPPSPVFATLPPSPSYAAQFKGASWPLPVIQGNWYPGRPLFQPIRRIQPIATTSPPVWEDELKALYHKRQAITYALNLRTFAARDKNGNGIIEPALGENGNYLRAIPLLDELKELGVNNIHVLPTHPIGEIDRLGEFGSPGSPYAPKDMTRESEELDEPGNGLTVAEEARIFVNEAKKRGIHVTADIPSCASVDLAQKRPELVSKDVNGNLLTPTNWIDIRMMVKDSPALRRYFQKYFDNKIKNLNVSGFRADIARARSIKFWEHFIQQNPKRGWLAETYTEEGASPMENIFRDLPEALLKAGFDTIYGQFHIFHDWNANQYMDYLLQGEAMLSRVGRHKSFIGSFVTHDDVSAMHHGGPLYCMLVSGLMMTQPNTNPYILDGFTTGYFHDPKLGPMNMTEHHPDFNIFDYRPRPQGRHPEIGRFLKAMIRIRQSPQYGPALTGGRFIPVKTDQNVQDPKVIAFMRQHGNKTLLVVANKDVNACQKATLYIEGLTPHQKLDNAHNLAPEYGVPSSFTVKPGHITAKLAPGKFYLFDMDTLQPYQGGIA